ncbi:hypothetical protein HK16_14105 [Acetobacter senegalensis]|uniref:Uncharacterized protein n=3 Tax=Acetobacter TaxID=434 RepID=A0A252EHZ8_9PROT|nr:hypothetical protein CIW82_01715 [Acetobacter tropicalis]OUL65834.1 hypothetical protein HK16_14105 [Acetobacter senegalensis]
MTAWWPRSGTMAITRGATSGCMWRDRLIERPVDRTISERKAERDVGGRTNPLRGIGAVCRSVTTA